MNKIDPECDTLKQQSTLVSCKPSPREFCNLPTPYSTARLPSLQCPSASAKSESSHREHRCQEGGRGQILSAARPGAPSTGSSTVPVARGDLRGVGCEVQPGAQAAAPGAASHVATGAASPGRTPGARGASAFSPGARGPRDWDPGARGERQRAS